MIQIPKIFSPLFAFMILTSSMAHSEENFALKAQTMWSAFECSVYAEAMTERELQEHLFTVGLEAGRLFLDRLEKEEISEKHLSSSTPMSVLFRLSGPSHDFKIGRVFEAAVESAYNKVSKNIDDKYKTEPEFRKIQAELLFGESNCRLIK